MNVILSWVFCLGTVALILLAVTSGNNLFEPAPARIINPPIESTLHNDCQSGELWPDFPRCQLQE